MFDAAALAASATGIAFDSRTAGPGSVFVAVGGVKEDGAKYAADAVARGATALVVRKGAALPAGCEAARVFEVDDERLALSELAAAFYGDPSRRLSVYGVTGTNGKTTTAGLLRDVLALAGRPCGLLSTVENAWPGHSEEASRTTPDPVTVQRSLAAMADAGCVAAAMEASSHALDQRRVATVRFAGAGFTNLSQDHFDYHAGFEDYYACKRLLFAQLGSQAPGAPAVVNADDAFGRRLLSECRGLGVSPVAYSLGPDGDVRASDVVLGPEGARFVLTAFGRSAAVETGLTGRYNVSNELCVAGMALAADVPFQTVVDALAAAKPRWGRLELAASPHGAGVFVDYAHSPDAIEKALTALREVTRGRLAIVFGCGGDRDRAKRPLMAAVAARLADFVVLTSDNPRSVDPETILDEVEAGIRGSTTPYVRMVDRREAIAEAIRRAGKGDVVLVAGKGHESYQEIAGVRHHFDDREVVREIARL